MPIPSYWRLPLDSSKYDTSRRSNLGRPEIQKGLFRNVLVGYSGLLSAHAILTLAS